MQELVFGNLKYIVKYPKGFNECGKYPLLFFLHGAGSRGNDINLLCQNPFFEITKDMELPFVTVAPQCNQNNWFDHFHEVKDLLFYIEKLSYIDNTRVYLIGGSMGGYATWQLAMSEPEHFAAIVPVCGGGMYWNASRLANIPVWAFHGAKDTVVECQESINMVNHINKSGGNAKLTIYPDNGHDAWSDTYKNPEVFKWLLKHTKGSAKITEDKFDNVKKFG